VIDCLGGSSFLHQGTFRGDDVRFNEDYPRPANHRPTSTDDSAGKVSTPQMMKPSFRRQLVARTIAQLYSPLSWRALVTLNRPPSEAYQSHPADYCLSCQMPLQINKKSRSLKRTAYRCHFAMTRRAGQNAAYGYSTFDNRRKSFPRRARVVDTRRTLSARATSSVL